MMVRTLALAALLATPLSGWTQQIGLTQPIVPKPSAVPVAGEARYVPRQTQVSYAVADLVVPIRGLDYAQDAANRQQEEAETKEAWLIDKVTTLVAADSWGNKGGTGTIRFYALGMALVVKQTPEVQAQVAELLATMRRVQNVEVSVETRLLSMNNQYCAKLRRQYPNLKKDGQLVLSDKQVLALLEDAQKNGNVEVLQLPRLTIFPGQRCKGGITDVLEYKLGVMVAFNLRHVEIDVKAEFPEINVKLEKVARLADGTTLVLPVRIDNERQLLYMVTPRVIINLSENVVAPMLPRRVFQTPAPNKVIQASAAEVMAPPMSAPARQDAKKQLQFKVCVYEGDPLGSRKANTLRTLMEPTVLTLENQSFFIHTGGEIPPMVVMDSVAPNRPSISLAPGISIEGKPGIVKNGQFRLDMTISKSAVADRTGDRVQVQTESTRTNMTVKLGEVMKLRLGEGTADRQTWVEITATEPANVDD